MNELEWFYFAIIGFATYYASKRDRKNASTLVKRREGGRKCLLQIFKQKQFAESKRTRI